MHINIELEVGRWLRRGPFFALSIKTNAVFAPSKKFDATVAEVSVSKGMFIDFSNTTTTKTFKQTAHFSLTVSKFTS